MYKIEKTEYGIKNIFSENINAYEMFMWNIETALLLTRMPRHFSIYTDITKLLHITDDAKSVLKQTQKAYMKRGAKKSVVVFKSEISAFQLKEIAKSSNLYSCEKYISVDSKDYEIQAMDWILG